MTGAPSAGAGGLVGRDEGVGFCCSSATGPFWLGAAAAGWVAPLGAAFSADGGGETWGNSTGAAAARDELTEGPGADGLAKMAGVGLT